jgi:hypothetical protein
MGFKHHRTLEETFITIATRLCRAIEADDVKFRANTSLIEFATWINEAHEFVPGSFLAIAHEEVENYCTLQPVESLQNIGEDAMISNGISYVWSLIRWAYNGFNILRLTRDDLASVLDLHKKLRATEESSILSTRFPFPAILIEYEVPFSSDGYTEGATFISTMADENSEIGQEKLNHWGLDYEFDEAVLGFRIGEGAHGGEEQMTIMGEHNPFLMALNFFLNEFPPEKRKGKKTRTKFAKRDPRKWVRPKIWLPHEPSTVHTTQPTAPGQVRPANHSDEERGRPIDCRRKSPIRHSRRGYWGWQAHGPKGSLRKLSWHKSAIVNPGSDTMATHSYAKDPLPEG